MDTKAKKRKQLRNNEYYDMQEVFDQLYANAGNNAKFTHLMQIVMSAENIKLAYRNIKKNKGSDTKGTDGKTIRDYESLNEEEMIAYFQSKMRNSIILGVHNYYSMAAMCNIDFHRVYFLVKPTMNRLKKNYTRGHPTNAIYLKLYGNYTTNIYNIAGIDVFPLYGVVLKKTLSFK